jgi:ferredoxin
MRLWVDPYRCVGHLICCDEAPDLFEFDEERSLAVAGDEEIPPEMRNQAMAAVRMCPEKAIVTLEDG